MRSRIGKGWLTPRFRLIMNTRYSETNHKTRNAVLLSLSQVSIAVLLAFSTAHVCADDTKHADTATRSGSALPGGDQHPAAAQPSGPDALADTAPPQPVPLTLNLAQATPPPPAEVQFDSQFLSGSGAGAVDISRFNKGNFAAPGQYRAALYVNNIWVGVSDVTLRDVFGPGRPAQPVMNSDLVSRIGIDPMRLPDAARAKLDEADKGGNVLLSELVPAATASFDMGEQRLNVSVPQAVMSHSARGWVDPKFWDEGINAAVFQYNANVYHSSGNGASTTQSYLGMNTGVNIGAWRFRYNGNVTNTSGTGSSNGTHVQSMQTYLQRSFAPIKSEFTFGDSYTDGSIFDSFGVRGMQITTDDRMYPESQRGYAPTVRGTANTNAKVQVRQNGNIIYETTVAPGPFQIDDLYPTGYGGDLQLVVAEADGSQHTSVLPYASPVNALREGRWRYTLAGGQYRSTNLNDTPYVFEAGLSHGLNNLVTLYGGTLFANDYVAVAGGIALNTKIGAFGFDVTQANTTITGLPSREGQSYRLSYSRTFTPTETDVTLAAYRYSTSGYLSLQDAMSIRDASRGGSWTNTSIQKGRLQLTLNQNLRQYGSVYASGYTQNYWNRSGNDTSFQVGYNTNIGRVGTGVSVSREIANDTGRWDTRVMLTLNIPLDLGAAGTASAITNYTHDSSTNSNLIQQSFSGSAGQDHQISYGVTAGHQWGDQSGNDISANAGYLSPFTQLRVNAGNANGYTQVGGGLSGSVVGYGDGVVFSPQTGDTLAIVEAKDAVGARVASAPGVRIDYFGHALIGGMEPYSQNQVDIDTKGLPLGVQLKSTEQRFAPTAGSVVRVKFDTENRGQAVVMRLRRLNGEPVPFGTDLLDEHGNTVGTVSQGSRAMFFGKYEAGELTASWGADRQQNCKVQYELPAQDPARRGSPIYTDAVCK